MIESSSLNVVNALGSSEFDPFPTLPPPFADIKLIAKKCILLQHAYVLAFYPLFIF
jgi:hypothetical protein